MGFFVVITAAIFIFGVYKLSESLKNKRSLALLIALKKHEVDFSNALADFQSLAQGNWYISDRKYRLWKAKYAHLAEMPYPDFNRIKTHDLFKKLVMDFSGFWNEGRKLFIDGYNESFVKQESPVIKNILNKKEIQNNNDQVTAIASDEDNTLLVAGAGTGKTTTILGKLAYLIERIKVKPEDILLLSFTGRAVDELADRIKKNFLRRTLKL